MIDVLKFVGYCMAAGCGTFLACALYLAGREDRRAER